MKCRDRLIPVATSFGLLLLGVGTTLATPQYQSPGLVQAPGLVQGPPQWIAKSAPLVLASGLLSNSGFESGDFTGWTVANEAGGTGDWFVYSGGLSPLSGFPIPPPPNGIFAATTDQTERGAHILYQDIAVPASPPTNLTFVIYYENRAEGFVTPPTLDALSSGDNQQFRVDIMDPAAAIDSVAPADVLLNVFQTQVGDPLTLAPTFMRVDLSPFAGQTVRLRFAEVDNMGFFQAGVDDGITKGTAAPALSPGGLSAVVVLLLFVGGWQLTFRQKGI